MPKSEDIIKKISISESIDGERQVVLRPENNDIFVRTGKQVISACSLGISVDLWLDEIASLIVFVREWAELHHTSVDGCYIEPRPRCVMLFFVPKSPRFDFDLAGELADLTVKLIKGFNVGMVECHQIPQSELEQFLNPGVARKIYGEQRDTDDAEAHRSMEA